MKNKHDPLKDNIRECGFCQLQKARRRRTFKFLTWLLIFVFSFNQITFAGDRIFYKYGYSVAKDLLPDRIEQDRSSRMAPDFLRRAQNRHEEIIRAKNVIEEKAVYFLDKRSRKEYEDDMPLKRKVDSGMTSGGRIEYTLSDFDKNGDPQQISVYTYGSDGKTLKKIITYDIRDLDSGQWMKNNLEKVSEEGEPKILGSFEEGDYSELADEFRLRTVAYFGKEGEEKVDYTLSDYREGKATEVSIYIYESGDTLKEVITYDVFSIAGRYDKKGWKEYIETEGRPRQEEVEAEGRLKRKAVYEGASGDERIIYALSEYDSDEVPGRLECYDYTGGDEGALDRIRSYNIKGLDFERQLSDFRENLKACDDRLASTTVYKGKKDREIVDYALTAYYLDTTDGEYKPARRSDYVYDEEERLDSIKTYCIKSGVNILRQCSEFTGLKGHEIVAQSYDYKADGVTLYSVSVYEYELVADDDNPIIGGDGNKYTLDRVTRYVGTDDPHDVSSASVKTETYYDGPEGREQVAYAFGFDIMTGDIITRTEYSYEEKALKEVSTYRILGGGVLYDPGIGSLVTRATYEGDEKQERTALVINYDLLEEILTTTAYGYGAGGALEKTVTTGSDGKKISETLYDGAEGQEKRSVTANFDLLENELTATLYTYSVIDTLEGTVTLDTDGTKISEAVYEGIEDHEKISLATSFDLAGEVTGTTEYKYDAGGALSSVVSKDPDGIKLTETLYDGPENYEKSSLASNFDLAGNLLSITDHSYDASGALNKTVTRDPENRKTSEMIYTGVMNRERALQAKNFDLSGSLLTATDYVYGAGGVLDKTTTAGADGVKLSETAYGGAMNRERALQAKNFDLSGNLLTVTGYVYGADGALDKTITTDTGGIQLSEIIYDGVMNREKVSRAENFDLSGNLLTTTGYAYHDDGALDKTTTAGADGTKLSETTYEGAMGRERADIVGGFDSLGEVLTVTGYIYRADGALEGTVTADADGVKLSETAYEGAMNRERAIQAKSFDLSGSLLTVTGYVYGVSGALDKTITNGADGTKLTETTYAGDMNREKVSQAENFDLSGNLLTTTGYIYHDNGALEGTVTADANGVKLSETTYKGAMNGEKIDFTESFDLLGNLLTRSDYFYDDTGALDKTTAYDFEGRKLSEVMYKGRMNREKIGFIENFDLAGKKLTVTDYGYNSDGSLLATVTYDCSCDPERVKISETAYEGAMNREKTKQLKVFDDDGISVLSTTTYGYDSSGALSESVTRDGDSADGKKLSEMTFTGLSGQEKNRISKNYDSREELQNTVHYIYADSGALLKTETRDPDDAGILSETRYCGLDGYEISDFTLNFRDDGTVKSTVCYFYRSFAGFESGEAAYETRRADEAFREDPLVRAETFEEGNENGDISGLLLDSVAYYKGKKNKEIVDFSQSYEFEPNSQTERRVKATTVYIYGEKRQLLEAYTYFGGNEGSKDASDLKHNYVARYEGERGEEKIYEMEGTTCEYPLDDLAEWDYFKRTDFTYDEEDRNTGYFERIFAPEGEWDWETDEDGYLIEAKEVRFSEFDEKDRYGRIEKDYFDWDDEEKTYTATGKKIVQESFQYDLDDNIISYKETNIVPGEDTKRYEFTFEEYSDKKPGIVTSWELDEAYSRTGDYSRKSDILYDEYGRMSEYTQDSRSDGKTSTYYIFEIIYDKDRVIEEKVHSPDEVIYFGEDHPTRGYKYSVREYKYNDKRRIETSIFSNGDYISISDSEGDTIYFEWTPDMAPFRENDSASEREPEGAGPRSGSQNPSNPVYDILQELREVAAHKDIDPDGRTQIEYTGDGQVERITDAKGNVFIYSGNRIIELRDNEGALIAVVDYDTDEDKKLTVTMEGVIDSRSAVFCYDEDRRKFSVSVADSLGEVVKQETYEYAKRDNGTVETVTVHREFYEADSLIIVDKVETYDGDERLIGIFTRSRDPGSKSSVASWTGEYDTDDKLAVSREIRCESVSFAFEDYTREELSGHFDLFAEGRFSDLSEADMQVYGEGGVLISDETWSAAYDDNGNIDSTEKEKSTFEYAELKNACSWPSTTHDYKGNEDGYKSIDGDYDTPMPASCGRSSSCYAYSEHIFDGPVDLTGIALKIQLDSYVSNDEPYGCWHYCLYEIKIYRDGAWESLGDQPPYYYYGGDRHSGSAGTTVDETVAVDLKDVEGIRIEAVSANGIAGGKGTGSGHINIYEIQVFAEGGYYRPVQLSDTITSFDAEEYDDKNNVTRYTETRTDHTWNINSSGLAIDQGELITETAWEGAYTVDRVDSFTQQLHKTNPQGTLDLTETTTRSGMQYQGGVLTGYNETFRTTAAPDLTIERQVSGMTYIGNKIAGFTEISHEFGEDAEGNSIDKISTTVRHDVVYDGWGNLTQWADDISSPAAEDEVTGTLIEVWEDDADLQEWFPNVDEGEYSGVGAWSGKNIAHWAQEIGYTEYDELSMYGPNGIDVLTVKITFGASYDDHGRMLAFTSVEEGLAGKGIGEPKEWQRKTAERQETVYNSLNQVIYSKDVITIELEDGTILEDYPKTVEKDDIIYNKSGQEYSYASIVNDESSRVGSSTYNSLGQLIEQYTRIDAYSYSSTYYYYDQAGNISRTKYYYYYHKTWSEAHGKDTVTYTQHNETTTWNDKYGEKTQEIKNEYFHVDIKKSFWSKTFGRYLITAIRTILGAVPTIGWALAMAFDTVVSIANGTFNWISMMTQIGMQVLKGFGGIIESPIKKMVDAIKDKLPWMSKFIGAANPTTGNLLSWEQFTQNLYVGAASTIVSEGINEVGRKSGWDTFLTSLVSTFASTAVSYACGSRMDQNSKFDFSNKPENPDIFSNLNGFNNFNFQDAAIKSFAIAAIDKYLEDNPSQWGQALGSLAKTAINQIEFSPNVVEAKEIKLSALPVGIREIAEEAGAKQAVEYKDRYGKTYYRFAVLNDPDHPLSPVMQQWMEKTYKIGMNLENNQSLEIVMSQNGREAYLLGDAGYNELMDGSTAKAWADMAGYKPGDKIEFEFNMKTGDLFMFLDVRNAAAFFSEKNCQKNEDIKNLRQMIIDKLGSIENLKSMEVAVRMREGDKGELVNARVTVDPASIKDEGLSVRVKDYLRDNFNELRGQFGIVLDLDPVNNKIDVKGLSVNLDRESLNSLLDSLKENTAKLRKLGREIEKLVDLADKKTEKFERIILSVNEKGDYTINVRIKSEALRGMPQLLSKLGMIEGSASFNRLSKREFTDLTIDVKSGAYMLDLSLRCKEFEGVIKWVGDTIKLKDSKGRLVKEEIFDETGSLIMTKEYTYIPSSRAAEALSGVKSFFSYLASLITGARGNVTGASHVLLKETFYATLADGSQRELCRTSEGIMMENVFMPDLTSTAVFDDFTGLEGATFNYPVGGLVVPVSIADGVMKATLPLAQMGVSLSLPGSGDAERLTYDVYTLGVRLEGDKLLVDDDKLFNINGAETEGAVLTSKVGDEIRSMFLYNDSEIGIFEGSLTIENGTALFSHSDISASAVIPMVDGGGSALGGNTELYPGFVSDKNVLHTPLDTLADFLVPPAIAQDAPDVITITGNTFKLSPDGSMIIPETGIFEIINNRVVSEKADSFNEILSGLSKSDAKALHTQQELANKEMAEHLKGAPEWLVKAFEKDIYSFGVNDISSVLQDRTVGDLMSILKVNVPGVNRNIMPVTIKQVYQFMVAFYQYVSANYPSFKEVMPLAMVGGAFRELVYSLELMRQNPGYYAERFKENFANFVKVFSASFDALNGMIGSSVVSMDGIRKNVEVVSKSLLDISGYSSIGQFWKDWGGNAPLENDYAGMEWVFPGVAFLKVMEDPDMAWYARPIAFITYLGIGKGVGKLLGKAAGKLAGSRIGKFAISKINDVKKGMQNGIVQKGGRLFEKVSRWMARNAERGAGQGTRPNNLGGRGLFGKGKTGFGGGILGRIRSLFDGAIAKIKGYTGKMPKYGHIGSKGGIKENISGNKGFGKSINIGAAESGARAAESGARAKVLSFFKGGLRYVADQIREIPGRIIASPIKKWTRSLIIKTAKGEGPIVEGAERFGEAWQRAWGGTGVRFRGVADWLIPGAAGITFASIVAPTVMKTSDMIKELIVPDFSDSASPGANFWTGVYEDISAAYEVAADSAINFTESISDDVTYAWDFWKEKVLIIRDWVTDKTDYIIETINLLPAEKLVKVTVREQGISQVDARLNWFNPRNIVQFLYDAESAFVTANSRWAKAAKITAKKITDELASGQTKIFTPGVNSSGYTKGVLLGWINSLDIPQGVKVRIGHSFGTHAITLSTLQDPEGKIVLLSQRINEKETKHILDKAGVKPEQLLTINCAGDFPHQPCDFCILLRGDIVGFIKSAFHGYESGPVTGYHLYIEKDGKKFNKWKWFPGANHGVQELSMNNEKIWGKLVCPDGKVIKYDDGKYRINDIINSFLNGQL